MRGKTMTPGVARIGQPDRRLADPDAPRSCDRCCRLKAIRHFPLATGRRADGTRYRKRTCADCLGAVVPAKRPRFDGHGNAWCHHCARYRAIEAFPTVATRPGPWPYCYDCRRDLDRLRWRGERRAKLNRRRVENQRAQAAREDADRRAFVANAILVLRKRGLTKAEVARLAGTTMTSLLDWERRERRVTPNAAERFAALLRATRDWPIGDPCWRRRTPHPRLAELAVAVASTLDARPLRSRWRGREAA